MKRGTWAEAALRAGTALLTAGALAGCSLLPTAEAEQKPIDVGTIDTVTSLDPAGAYDAGSWSLYSNLYQSLMTFTPGATRPVPDAAKWCRFSGADLRTFRCELRRDLKFPSGRKVTAEDVRYSFDRIATIKNPQGPLPVLDTLKHVRAEGRTVTFELSTPDATFPYKIATGAGSIVDSRRYQPDRLRQGTSVDGTGPYLLNEYIGGRKAVLVPNPHYKGAVRQKGGPVNIHYFTDPDRLGKAWKQGRLDVAARQMPPEDIKKFSSPTATGVKVMANPAGTTRMMAFNVRKDSPMHRREVRQAVAELVDRPALARKIHHRTVVALYSLIPQGMSGHTTTFYDRYPKPDAERARAGLVAAGVRLPVDITLGYSSGAATDEETAELRRQLESSGLFRVKTVRQEWTAFQKSYANGDFDAFCIGWVADFPDPDTFTAPLVGKKSALHTGYRNAEIDELIRGTQRNSRRARAVTDFHAVQRIVARDIPILPLWQKKDYVLGTETITGTQYLSDGTGVWRLWRLGRM